MRETAVVRGTNDGGIEKDAAGPAWSVILCQRRDLASAASQRVHGGLRYVEHCKFRLVREALLKCEALWRIAPFIRQPRMISYHHKSVSPAWLLRFALLLYDRLDGRERLPPTRIVRFEAELNDLTPPERALTAEDVVWRRSKRGLRMSKRQTEKVDRFLRAARPVEQAGAAVPRWTA